MEYLKSLYFTKFSRLIADKEKYDKYVTYSYYTPRIRYVWLVHRNEIIFLKCPNSYIKSDIFIPTCFVVFENGQNARKVARGMTPQILRRVFKKANSIII